MVLVLSLVLESSMWVSTIIIVGHLIVVDKSEWYFPPVYGQEPIPRTNHALTAVDTKVYMFGGNDTTKQQVQSALSAQALGTYGDFQMFDTETFTWSTPETKGKGPCPRSGHHMVAVGRKVYLFGGGLWNDKLKVWTEKYSDMYTFDVGKYIDI
jgi:hypothetical protein